MDITKRFILIYGSGRINAQEIRENSQRVATHRISGKGNAVIYDFDIVLSSKSQCYIGHVNNIQIMTICLSILLSVSLSVCLSVCLYVHQDEYNSSDTFRQLKDR